MQREQAWMSMSEGSTGTRILSASRVMSASWRGSSAAGVSTITCVATSGTRSWNARVVRESFSNAAIA